MLKTSRNGFLFTSLLKILPLFFASTTCFAVNYNGHWYVNASGGASRVSVPGSTTVPNGSSELVPPYDTDTYSISNPSTKATFGLGAGYQWHATRTFLPYFSVGFQYAHIFSNNINGVITQYSTPGFENYTYNVNYYADLFTLNGKVDLIDFHSFLPYVSLGLGGADNQVTNYREYPTPSVTPRISPNYNDQNNENVIYTLGAGIDYKYSDALWFTLGYEHENLGNVQTGQGTGTWSSTNIDFGTFKNNMIFAAVSYYFPSSI